MSFRRLATLYAGGAGSASGSGDASGAGGATAGGAGSASGAGAASGVAGATAGGVGSAAGVGSAGGAGGAVSTGGVGSASGASAAVATAGALSGGDGSTTGTGSAAGTAGATGGGDGSSAGVGSASTTGGGGAGGDGSGSGSSSVAGGAGAIGGGDGSSTGVGAGTDGDAGGVAGGAGTSSGDGEAAAEGGEYLGGAGAASGSGNAAGAGGGVAGSDGSSAGAGTASGIGVAASGGAGSAAGSSTASGSGGTISAGGGNGLASGAGSVTAVGGANQVAAVGDATGVGSEIGQGGATAGGDGSAAGSSTAIGIPILPPTGVAAGTCVVLGVGGARSGGVGSVIIGEPAVVIVRPTWYTSCMVQDLVQGDREVPLVFELLDVAGNPANIADAVLPIRLRWRRPDGTSATVDLTPVSLSQGIVRRDLAVGDTDVPGTHLGQVVVLRALGQQTYPIDGEHYEWVVHPALPVTPSADPTLAGGTGLAAGGGGAVASGGGAPLVPEGSGGGGGGGDNGIEPTDDAVTTLEDTVLNGNVLSNDTTLTGTLQVFTWIVDGAVQTPGSSALLGTLGTLSMSANGSYSFTPAPNVSGTCPVVTYMVTNGRDVRVATLTITITPVNDPPAVSGAFRTSVAGESVVINLLATANDPEGDALSVTLINGIAPVAESPISVTNGTITYHTNGTITVAPSITEGGEVTFTYRIADVHGLHGDATAVVRVGVDNLALVMPIAPTVPGIPEDDAAIHFLDTYMQEMGPNWPNVGPNGTPVNLGLYTTDKGFYILNVNREPWLYDRATMMWIMYRRTKDARYLTIALALAEQYFAAVVIDNTGLGGFTVEDANTDDKYMYPIIAWWYELETGSPVFRVKAEALYKGILAYWPKTQPGAPLWTERGVAYAILGCMAQYVISGGDDQPLQDATDYFEGVLAITVGGAPLHPHSQHEGDSLSTPISSPWMSALLFESLLIYYRITRDARVLTFFSNYADWLMAHASYLVEAADEPEFADLVGTRLICYLAGNAGPTDFGQEDDIAHGRDLEELFKRARWAKQQLSLDTTAVDAYITGQALVGRVDEDYWTRTTPGYPRYRCAPARKYTWKHRNAYSSEIYDVGQVPIAPVLRTDISISGSAQQGSTLTVTPGLFRGQPTPTITYQWYRDGVPLAGATATTYVTVTGDIGHSITCRATATNAGGAATSTSNTIAVVLVGTPEITVQPTPQAAAPGDTASFIATVTATPTATFQWQVSANGGSTWANVTTGTGGSGTGNTPTYTTATLTGGDTGLSYRCVFTNIGGSVTTDVASLSLVVQQDAVRFAGNSAGAHFAGAFGDLGHTHMTWEALVYLEGITDTSSIMDMLGVAGRLSVFGFNNSFPTPAPAIGDASSRTGFADPIPLTAWTYANVRFSDTAGGTVTASFTAAEGGATTVYTQTHTNGNESSIPVTAVSLNGGSSNSFGTGVGSAAGIRYQYVRVKTGTPGNDASIAADRLRTDASSFDFWWHFHDDGAGGVAVTDKSGHGKVPTIVNGTLATGPTVPTVV